MSLKSSVTVLPLSQSSMPTLEPDTNDNCDSYSTRVLTTHSALSLLVALVVIVTLLTFVSSSATADEATKTVRTKTATLHFIDPSPYSRFNDKMMPMQTKERSIQHNTNVLTSSTTKLSP